MQSTQFVIKFDATPRRGNGCSSGLQQPRTVAVGTLVSLEFIGKVPEGVREADQTRN
jgi:hypothetical protein